MSTKRGKRIKQMLALDESGQITPDRSRELHRFADGWSVRALETAGCYRREGKLMANCAWRYVPAAACDEQPFTMADRTDLKARQQQCVLVSLRCEANLPAATCWLLPGEALFSCLGYFNNPLKNEYADRLQELAKALGVHYFGAKSGNVISLRELIDGEAANLAPAAPDHADRPALLTSPRIMAQRTLGQLIAGAYHLGEYPALRSEAVRLIAQVTKLYDQFDSLPEHADIPEVIETGISRLGTQLIELHDHAFEQGLERGPRESIWAELEREASAVAA